MLLLGELLLLLNPIIHIFILLFVSSLLNPLERLLNTEFLSQVASDNKVFPILKFILGQIPQVIFTEILHDGLSFQV